MTFEKSGFKETEIGEFPKEWQVKPVKDFCSKITSGGTPSRANPEYWNKGQIPWLKTQELQDNIIYCSEEYITQKGLENSSAKLFPPDTVLMAMYGATVGKLGILKIQATTNQAFCAMIVNNVNDYHFLFYALLYRRSDLINLACGAAQQNLNQDIIKEFLLPSPNLKEQKAIGKILSDIDAKIELSKRMNENLEAIGQTLFKRWFVDFEFPNQGKPYKSTGGKMKSTDFGEIPEGWSIKPFSEVIAVNPARKIEKSAVSKKVEMADLTPWQTWIESCAFDKCKSGSRFQNGDTLLARITPCLENGKTGFVSFLNKNEIAFGSTEFIVLGPKTIQSSYFILYLAISNNLRASAIQSMTGSSGRQRVPNDFFDDFTVAVPPSDLLSEFDSLVAPMFAKITNNVEKSGYLGEIRDLLLPKLMSGKIRVPIENEVELS